MNITNKISFKFNEDCRSYKRGDEAVIEMNDSGIVCLVGSNECGKSTLLQLMRSRCDSMKKSSIINNDMSVILFNLRDVKVDIEGLDYYGDIFYLDAIIDDPLSMENSASAGSFIEGGGMLVQKMSKGKKSIFMLNQFIKRIETVRKENGFDAEKKMLIVMDEVDEGLDIAKQSQFHKTVMRMMEKYNADFIIVTHSLIPILSSGCNNVFHCLFKRYISMNDYLSLLLKKDVKISINDIDDKDMMGVYERVLGLTGKQ